MGAEARVEGREKSAPRWSAWSLQGVLVSRWDWIEQEAIESREKEKKNDVSTSVETRGEKCWSSVEVHTVNA